MWTYKNKSVNSKEDLPDYCVGFVYQIYNVTKNKYYIGKKSLYTKRNVNVAKSTYEKLSRQEKIGYTKTKDKKKSKKGKPVWLYKKLVVKESNWLTYTGSNKELNQDIKDGDKIEKMIIDIAFDSRKLTYLETKHQFKNDVLESDNYYNTNILGRFFP